MSVEASTAAPRHGPGGAGRDGFCGDATVLTPILLETHGTLGLSSSSKNVLVTLATSSANRLFCATTACACIVRWSPGDG